MGVSGLKLILGKLNKLVALFWKLRRASPSKILGFEFLGSKTERMCLCHIESLLVSTRCHNSPRKGLHLQEASLQLQNWEAVEGPAPVPRAKPPAQAPQGRGEHCL